MSNDVAIQTDFGQFDYEGVKYVLKVGLTFSDGQETTQFDLLNSNIIDLEIFTCIDKWYVDGFIIYEDTTGRIGRMVGLMDSGCNILFQQIDQQVDGKMINEKMSKTQIFSHNFIVNGVEIVERKDDETIIYCINIAGNEYKNLDNKVDYTSYKGEQQEDDGGENIIKLMKTMLQEYGKLETDTSFENSQSEVITHYTSTENDTVKSSLDYLLQKQFFYPEKTESKFKLLIYDVLDQKYKICDFESSDTNTYNIVISTNKTGTEKMLNKEMVQMTSVSEIKRGDLFQDLSRIKTFSYSLQNGDFSSINVAPEEITNEDGGDKTIPTKTDEQTNMERVVTQWDNDLNIYKEFLDRIVKYDSMVLNIGGVINRRLWDCVIVVFDNLQHQDMVPTDKKTCEDMYMSRLKQLSGTWRINAVRSIIKPQKSTFKQNLHLSRNKVEK